MIDGLVLMICGLAAIMGWRRGTLLTALPVVGLVTGYAAAFTLYRPLAAPLVDRGVPALAAYPVAGLGALVAVVLLFRAVAWWVKRRQDRPSDFERALGFDDDELGAAGPASDRPAMDRAGGAALNALWAFGVLMILVWAAESFVAVRGGTDAQAASFTGGVAGEVVGAVGKRVTASRLGDDFSASTVGALLRDPGEFRRMVDGLAAKPAVRRLAGDAEVLRLLAEGRVAELARRPELAGLLDDPEFREALRRVGVVEGGSLSVDELASALASSLGPVARAITSLREDGELGATAERLDPARLRGGDLMAVLTDADFAALVSGLAERLKGQAR